MIMEMDELKKNWSLMEKRLEQLEMENRRLQGKAVSGIVHQFRRRLIMQLALVLIFLPNLFWIVDHQMEGFFSRTTWILLFVFVSVVVARQIVWWWMIGKIDCLEQTVREASLAEARFRIAFKAGIAAGLVFALPLLVSLLCNISQSGNSYMLIGAWTGIAIGLPIGLCVFFRKWRDIKGLREAIAELQDV